jgi:hypothetical protein
MGSAHTALVAFPDLFWSRKKELTSMLSFEPIPDAKQIRRMREAPWPICRPKEVG